MATPWVTTASTLAIWLKAKRSKGEEPAPVDSQEPPDNERDGYIIIDSATKELPEVQQNKAHKADQKRLKAQRSARRLSALANETSDRITIRGIIRANFPVLVSNESDDESTTKGEEKGRQVEMDSDEEFYQSESYESEVESEDEFIIKEAERGIECDHEINLVGTEIIIKSNDEITRAEAEREMESDVEVSPKEVDTGGVYEDARAECYPRPNMSLPVVSDEHRDEYSGAEVSVTQVAPDTNIPVKYSAAELKPFNKDESTKTTAAPPPPSSHRKSRHYRLEKTWEGQKHLQAHGVKPRAIERNPFHGRTATGSMAMGPRMTVHEQKSLIRPRRHERQPFILSHGIPRDVPEPANQETPKLWQPGRKEVLAALHRGMIPQGRVMTQSERDDEQEEELRQIRAQAIQ